jgi:hypothetical protein
LRSPKSLRTSFRRARSNRFAEIVGHLDRLYPFRVVVAELGRGTEPQRMRHADRKTSHGRSDQKWDLCSSVVA